MKSQLTRSSLFPPKPTRAWAGTDFHQELITSDDWLVEPKWDGDRILIRISKNGNPELWSRHGTPIRYDWLGDLRKELQLWDLPEGLILDGELMHEPKPNQDVYIFDVPTAPGGCANRRDILKALFGELPTECCHIHMVEELDPTTAYETALRMGCEGIVWKRKDSPYEWQKGNTETPVSYWVKMKPAQKYK